ncbi:MAG TPA: branched-chain amino acid ABC transporter permease, partial [Treponemataceae bacterium]|nr:branched-chain amino acid ABC transporter permease [Treponemataceae bacterium]
RTYGLTFPSDPPLFSEQWWDLTNWFLQAAKQKGMSVSLSDYTLGTAGQGSYIDEILEKNPGLRGATLTHEAKDITGGANGKRFTTILAASADIAWIVIIGTLVATIIFLQNFLRSTYGRAILSVREDEIAANSNGIGIFKYKMTGFVVAAFVAGVAGALYAPFIGFVKPDLASFNRSVDYLIYVVLGGMGSITGSVLAAFVLTYLQEFLRFLKEYRLLIYPVILILVMLFRPQGLLGMKELSFVRVWQRLTQPKGAKNGSK